MDQLRGLGTKPFADATYGMMFGQDELGDPEVLREPSGKEDDHGAENLQSLLSSRLPEGPRG